MTITVLHSVVTVESLRFGRLLTSTLLLADVSGNRQCTIQLFPTREFAWVPRFEDMSIDTVGNS